MASKYSLCGQVAANTGQIDCDVRRGVPQLMIVGSASFTPANYSTGTSFRAAYIAKFKKANTASDKLFPFPVIQETTDQTVAAKTGTLGYGLVVTLTRSKPSYQFGVLSGSSLEKKLMKYNGKVVPVQIFDDNQNIWGVSDTAGNFSGAYYLLSVDPAGFGDANNVKTTKITISIVDSKDFTENSKAVTTDFSTSDLTGLLDAVVFETAAHTTNVYKIGLKILTDVLNTYINVHDTAAAALANAANWVAKVGPNFQTALAITTVTDDTVNGGWTVTFDSTAYAALAAGALIQLNITDPATLDTANVTGIEGTALILIK